MIARYRLTGLSVAAALLAGCAAVPSDAQFGDVQASVAQRTGQRIEWRGSSADDASVDQAIHDMLREPLNVDQAVQIALLSNRNLQAAYEDLGIAQADVVQAGLLKNPVFDLGLRFPTSPPSKTFVDVSVAEDFINVLFLPARRRLAQAQFDQAKSRVANQVLNLAADTKVTFYRYQYSLQAIAFWQTIAAAAADSLDASRRLRDAGNITELEYTAQRSREVRARLDAAAAQADADDSRERLTAMMGIGGADLNYSIAARLPDLPAVDPSRDGLEELAMKQRLDLAAARQELIVQGRTLGLVIDTRFFSDAGVGAEADRETDGQWRVGPKISIPLPIFDQGQASVARARAMLRQGKQKYAALVAEARSQIRAAQARMTHSRQRVQLYHDDVIPIQQQLVDQSQRHFNGMFVSVFQLLQARRDQIEADRDYLQAVRDYWIARAELEQAAGGKLPDAPKAILTTQPATK